MFCAASLVGRRFSVPRVDFTQPLAGDHLRFIFPHDTEPMDTHLLDRCRVWLTQPCCGLPAGTMGGMTFIYHVAHNLYRVYF